MEKLEYRFLVMKPSQTPKPGHQFVWPVGLAGGPVAGKQSRCKKNAESGSGSQAVQMQQESSSWVGAILGAWLWEETHIPIVLTCFQGSPAPGSWPQHVPCKFLCNQPVQRGSEGMGWHLCLPSLEMFCSVSFLCRQKSPGLTHPPALAFVY